MVYFSSSFFPKGDEAKQKQEIPVPLIRGLRTYQKFHSLHPASKFLYELSLPKKIIHPLPYPIQYNKCTCPNG